MYTCIFYKKSNPLGSLIDSSSVQRDGSRPYHVAMPPPRLGKFPDLGEEGLPIGGGAGSSRLGVDLLHKGEAQAVREIETGCLMRPGIDEQCVESPIAGIQLTRAEGDTAERPRQVEQLFLGGVPGPVKEHALDPGLDRMPLARPGKQFSDLIHLQKALLGPVAFTPERDFNSG